MNTSSNALKLKIKGYFGNNDMEIGSNVTDPIYITSFDFSPATPTVTDLDISQQSRKVFVSNFQRDRTVSIEGVIIAYEFNTLEYYSQKLQRALYPDVNKTVEFTLTSLAGKDYQFDGVLVSLTTPDSPDNGQYAKKFQAQIKFDGVPFLKSLDLQTGLKAISVLGLEIPELGLEITGAYSYYWNFKQGISYVQGGATSPTLTRTPRTLNITSTLPYIFSGIQLSLPNIKGGASYTFTFDCKGSNLGVMNIYAQATNNPEQDFTINSTWASYSITLTPSNSLENMNFYIRQNGFYPVLSVDIKNLVITENINTPDGIEITDGNSGTLTLVNNGNATTYPTWYFTGQGTNWAVTNMTANKGSFIMGTNLTSFDIADGQTVIVDSLNQTVLQGGSSRDGFNVQNFDGLVLVAGTNTVNVTVASNNNTNTQVSVEYFYYYQGI
jgi:hypothetical protein